jgi:hypothetical protein
MIDWKRLQPVPDDLLAILEEALGKTGPGAFAIKRDLLAAMVKELKLRRLGLDPPAT